MGDRANFDVYTNPKTIQRSLQNGTNVIALKGQAELGRDFFTFIILPSGQVIPSGILVDMNDYTWGAPEDWRITKTCNPGETPTHGGINGTGCAQRILQDGWQMKY